MITSTPLSLPWISSWIQISSAFIIFGFYHGFIATLPIGPSQLLSIRAFLLGGNLSGIIGVSGSVMGQLMIFLSIYYSPLYAMLAKPHTFTLLVLPYILLYWYRIKDLLNYQSLRPITSFQDTRIYELFFDSLTLQLLNPILLPSPVLARLLNLFLFRYSNKISFLISTFFGWVCGQYIFIRLGRFLLLRIESDSTVLYLLVKRIIHRTFSIIILSFSLLHLGRTPVPFVTRKILDTLRLTISKREESLRSQKSWPSLFFDYRQWKRPLRYLGNSRSSTLSPVKRKVSQYFFDVCSSDGKQRLSFAYLPSLAVFEKNFRKYFNRLEFSPQIESFEEWISVGRDRKKFIFNEFQHRIEFLDNGLPLGEVIEKKTGLSNFEGEIFNKFCDPLLGGEQSDGIIMISKPSWLLTERFNKLKKGHKSSIFPAKNNKFKIWISNQWRGLEYKNYVLPWESLTRDARRILGLLISKSKKLDFDGGTTDQTEKKIFPAEDTHKKINRKSNLDWEFVFNLSPRQRVLYFNYIQIDNWNILKIYWKNLFKSTQAKNTYSFSLAETSRIVTKFQEMNKEVPRWTSDLKNDKFDVIAIGVTDIRQRRVKNLGYLIRGRDKRRKIVRRFSQQSDFRRKLVKGTMRSRRRKTLVWKMFQLEINSPFFSRISEKPTSVQTSSNKKNLFETSRTIFLNKNKESIIISSPKKTRSDRLSIANRWDFPLAQWGRSWLLITQSHLRKYVVLPTLVILKNISRLLLFQNPEWSEDWIEWNKEIHIRCTYDGTEVSERELPEQWLRDGLQIKIVYPFCLKPWHSSSIKSKIDPKRFMNRKKLHHCYLTAWGFLTDLPFGNTKKQVSFWKPINRELKKRWENTISLGFLPIRVKSPKVANILDLEDSNSQINKSFQSNWHVSDPNVDYRKVSGKNNHDTIEKSSVVENGSLRIPDNSGHGTSIYIQELKDFVVGDGEKASNSDLNIDYHFSIEQKSLELTKQLIRIERVIIRSWKKNSELINKGSLSSEIDIKKIIMNFQVGVEILKESIENIFSGYN
uniref:Protein TIC 214 n=1 Tax=Pallavicinia longispina TaxID=280536 RepID=A0AAT9UTR5_9MARC